MSRLCNVALGALLVTAPALTAGATVRRVQHEYDLADYQGDVDTSFATLAYDAQHGELFVITGDTISVFRKGLKVFGFKTDPRMGIAFSVVALDDGDLLVASVRGLYRCNFRGRLVGRFELKGAPPGVAGIQPNFVQRAAGKLYLAATTSHLVVIAEEDGTYVASYDLARLVFGNKVTHDHDIAGFSVDPNGHMLFTVPALFKAYIVSPNGKVHDFGKAGSKHGAFNIARAIVRDERGIVYVADMLRSTVILFDSDLQFIGEIGGPGEHRGSLIAPVSLAVGDGLLFVSQGAERGVGVFRIVGD
jgi:hypothetical protein